ncbi:MAG: RNA 2',3'-cyclic phosphodiesterase [Alkalilacustris sp.]
MIRAFLALVLPDALRQRLLLAQQMLQLPRDATRLVAPEELHLTLLFLGEQPRPLLEDLHLALEGVRAPGFDLELRGIGRFGAPLPRSVHACAPAQGGLLHLHRKLASCVRGNGIALERRRFVPHVTLARLDPRRIADPDRDRIDAIIAANADFAAGPAPITGFTLMRSYLGKGGSHHEELARYDLAASGAPTRP